jgi:hypothetical protein
MVPAHPIASGRSTLVLLSIGGNDIGFGAVALYATIENARDMAPIAGLVGGEIRFGPDVANAYLAVLDKRIKAVRDALVDGFGVEPSRVLQNAYEPIQFDETGSYCGNQATLGMDVHSPRSRSTRRGSAKPPTWPANCRSGSPAWRAAVVAGPAVLRPEPAPASASSPITSPTSRSAASVRAIRPAR